MNTFINIKRDLDPNQNFWKLNPHLIYMKPFSELYAIDKSKEKVESSKNMWCILWLSDPDEDTNKYYRLPEDEIEIVCKTFNPKFDRTDELVQECMDTYPEVCLTTVERTLKTTLDLLKRRDKFLKTIEYDLNTMAAIDTAIAKSPKMLEDYDKMYQQFVASKHKGVQLHGGRQQTAREKNQIRPDLSNE